jgi:flagellar protein FlgJ
MKLRPNVFVQTYLPFARQTEEKTGIDVMFTLAQAALESGWGERATGNMFFGVKATEDTPANKKQLLRTREVLNHDKGVFPEIISVTKRTDGKYEYVVWDWFRKYNSPEESFSDHAGFFFKSKRWQKALEVRYNPYLFADEIAKAGYATDPNYATRLKEVIKTIEKNMP